MHRRGTNRRERALVPTPHSANTHLAPSPADRTITLTGYLGTPLSPSFIRLGQHEKATSTVVHMSIARNYSIGVVRPLHG
jgi:hypothetical protein